MSGLDLGPLALVVGRLQALGSRQQGREWQCPAHDDHNPSLTVSVGTDQTAKRPDTVGNVLLWCHAGCSFDQILTALNLQRLDLVAPENRLRSRGKPRPLLADIERRILLGELHPVQILGDVPEGLSSPWVTEAAIEVEYLLSRFYAAGENRPWPCGTEYLAKRLGWLDSHGLPIKTRASLALRELIAIGYIKDAGALPGRAGLRGTRLIAPPDNLSTAGPKAVEL
jgi:hypothetical protein